MQSSMLYQYGNSNNPSRLNPRMPNAKKGENEEDHLDKSYADLLDDNTGLLSSLISDSKLRTPMDLIQADFPSTPSSVYSNRIKLEARADNNAEEGAESALATSNTTASSASSNDNDKNVDQATKSFQQLYVNSAPVSETFVCEGIN